MSFKVGDRVKITRLMTVASRLLGEEAEVIQVIGPGRYRINVFAPHGTIVQTALEKELTSRSVSVLTGFAKWRSRSENRVS